MFLWHHHLMRLRQVIANISVVQNSTNVPVPFTEIHNVHADALPHFGSIGTIRASPPVIAICMHLDINQNIETICCCFDFAQNDKKCKIMLLFFKGQDKVNS